MYKLSCNLDFPVDFVQERGLNSECCWKSDRFRIQPSPKIDYHNLCGSTIGTPLFNSAPWFSCSLTKNFQYSQRPQINSITFKKSIVSIVFHKICDNCERNCDTFTLTKLWNLLINSLKLISKKNYMFSTKHCWNCCFFWTWRAEMQ